MAADVVGETPAHLFLVLFVNLTLVIFVTALAGVGRLAIGVAGGARVPGAAVVHREDVRLIVRGHPGAFRDSGTTA